MHEDLEKQYAPSQWVPETLPEDALMFYEIRVSRGSYVASGTVPNRQGVSYGETENSKIDIFGEEELPKGAPIFVFFHGGYWIAGSRDQSSFFVRPFYFSKILCMVFGYDLISETFSLPELVTQIQKGINFILTFAQTRGSRGVYFCGHSAGAHLITMALSLESADKDLYKLIRGIILLSGIYDLKPLLPTTNATAARITDDIAECYSPIKFVNMLKDNLDSSVNILIVAAEHDSPAFKEQSENYFELLKNTGYEQIELKIFSELDHFMIVYNLGNESFIVTKKIIEFITTEDKKIYQQLKKEAKLKSAEAEKAIKEEKSNEKFEESMVGEKGEELTDNSGSKDLYEKIYEVLGKLHDMDSQAAKAGDQSMETQQETKSEIKQDTNKEIGKSDNNEQVMETQPLQSPSDKVESSESSKSKDSSELPTSEMQIDDLLHINTNLSTENVVFSESDSAKDSVEALVNKMQVDDRVNNDLSKNKENIELPTSEMQVDDSVQANTNLSSAEKKSSEVKKIVDDQEIQGECKNKISPTEQTEDVKCGNDVKTVTEKHEQSMDVEKELNLSYEDNSKKEN